MRFFALASLAFVSMTEAVKVHQASPVRHGLTKSLVSIRAGLKIKALSQAKCEAHVQDFAHGIWYMTNTNGDDWVSFDELTAALNYLEANHKEIAKHMEDGFKDADANKNGSLSKEELDAALANATEYEARFVRAVVKMLDLNGDGHLSWKDEVVPVFEYLAEHWGEIRPQIEAGFTAAAGEDGMLTIEELNTAIGC